MNEMHVQSRPSSNVSSAQSTKRSTKQHAGLGTSSASAAKFNPLACLGYRRLVAPHSPLSEPRISLKTTSRLIPRQRTASTADSSVPPVTPTRSLGASSLSSLAAGRGPLASIRKKLRTRSSTGSLRLPSVGGDRLTTLNISHPRPLRPRFCSTASMPDPLSPPVLPLPPLRTLQEIEPAGEFGELATLFAAPELSDPTPSHHAPDLSSLNGRYLSPDINALATQDRYSTYSTCRSTIGSYGDGFLTAGKWPSLLKRRRDRLEDDWMWVGVRDLL